jgi:hypothetical protein
MSNIVEKCQVFAKGRLRLYEKNTGVDIYNKNLVVKNSAHVAVLGLGQDITQREVRMASWGDNFVETPSQTGYNWTKFESLESDHAIDGNHTQASINVTGHSYPASRAIKFTFEFDRNNLESMLGKNILEWGLFFNGVMFSRVALETDFVFQRWMTIVGEWTIIFSNCAGGYENFYLNQYELSSVWGMNTLQNDGTVEDYAGKNDLTGKASGGVVLARDVLGEPKVDRSTLWPDNSLATLYTQNALFIKEAQQDGGLDLRSGQFTIWQWFRIIDTDAMNPSLNYFTLLSKWASVGSAGDRSYRLRLVKTGGQTYLRFEINDGGTIKTLDSTNPLDFDADTTIGAEDTWCLAVLRLDYASKTLKMFFNNEEAGSMQLPNRGVTPLNDTTFYIGNEHWKIASGSGSYRDGPRPYGFIAETGISKDVFSDTALNMLWSNGAGQFYTP